MFWKYLFEKIVWIHQQNRIPCRNIWACNFFTIHEFSFKALHQISFSDKLIKCSLKNKQISISIHRPLTISLHVLNAHNPIFHLVKRKAIFSHLVFQFDLQFDARRPWKHLDPRQTGGWVTDFSISQRCSNDVSVKFHENHGYDHDLNFHE